jgi:mono/diheme cytochrome c family protein
MMSMLKKTRVKSTFSALAMLVAFTFPVWSQDDNGGITRSVQSGVYTGEQATRGEELFSVRCTACHNLGEFNASSGYLVGWNGQSVDSFFDLVRATMPEDNPGELDRGQYADLIAYIFLINGLPTGDAEMDAGELKNLTIEGPYGESK